MMPFTRGGIIAEENRGAMRNRGVIARKHQDEARELAGRQFAEQLVHEPTIVGIAVYRAAV